MKTVFLNVDEREPWPEDLAELIVNDPLVHAAYHAHRMNGWSRTEFLERCVVGLANARRELIDDALKQDPPALLINGKRFELVRPARPEVNSVKLGP